MDPESTGRLTGQLFACVLSGCLTGLLAERRGRAFWVYFALGAVLPGILMLVVATLLPYRCMKCRRDMVPDGRRTFRCPACGLILPPGSGVAADTPDGPVRIEDPDAVWACPQCGASNPNTQYTCRRCGASLV